MSIEVRLVELEVTEVTPIQPAPTPEEDDPAADRRDAVDKVAKRAVEQLGVDADSAYVTHHDVLRAATLSARLALQGVDIEHIWQLQREAPPDTQLSGLDNAQGDNNGTSN